MTCNNYIINYKESKALNTSGQSIIEIVVALGIFAVIAGTMVSSLLGGLAIAQRSGEYLAAGGLAQEGLEAVAAIRNRGWDELSYGRSAVTSDSNYWEFAGEGTTDNIDGYTRVIDFLPVYRDSDGNLADAAQPGTVLDTESREVRATVSWKTETGGEDTISYTTYLTNWRQ